MPWNVAETIKNQHIKTSNELERNWTVSAPASPKTLPSCYSFFWHDFSITWEYSALALTLCDISQLSLYVQEMNNWMLLFLMPYKFWPIDKDL